MHSSATACGLLLVVLIANAVLAGANARAIVDGPTGAASADRAPTSVSAPVDTRALQFSRCQAWSDRAYRFKRSKCLRFAQACPDENPAWDEATRTCTASQAVGTEVPTLSPSAETAAPTSAPTACPTIKLLRYTVGDTLLTSYGANFLRCQRNVEGERPVDDHGQPVELTVAKPRWIGEDPDARLWFSGSAMVKGAIYSAHPTSGLPHVKLADIPSSSMYGQPQLHFSAGNVKILSDSWLCTLLSGSLAYGDLNDLTNTPRGYLGNYQYVTSDTSVDGCSFTFNGGFPADFTAAHGQCLRFVADTARLILPLQLRSCDFAPNDV